MLHAQFLKNLIGGLSPAGFEVCISLSNSLDRFAIVLFVPGKVSGQDFIKRRRRILTVALSIAVQLRLAFGSDWDCIHDLGSSVAL